MEEGRRRQGAPTAADAADGTAAASGRELFRILFLLRVLLHGCVFVLLVKWLVGFVFFAFFLFLLGPHACIYSFRISLADSGSCVLFVRLRLLLLLIVSCVDFSY